MDKFSNNVTATASSEPADNAIDVRMLRTMAATVGVVVVVSALISPWRVSTGLLLGGLLSLLSHHWLRMSIAATFDRALGKGTKPQFTSAKYILRYFVVAAAVLVAYQLEVVSLPATIAGLCSFVVALFVEALREFYFAIIHREEIS